MNDVSIIMYHYVRELQYSRFPDIKALKAQQFREQIDYLRKHYTIISAEDCIRAVKEESYKLPPKSALLTFDDGYIDHFTTVFPILDRYKLPGCFFVPVKTVKNHDVLDVNKIHFILASASKTDILIEDINDLLLAYKNEFNLRNPHYYYKKLAKKGRYDLKDVVFIKRLLQKELVLELRKKIIDQLFKKYVSNDEKAFSRELYMSPDQIKCMTRNGMYVGGHGYDHFWLNQLTNKQQEDEIERTIDFLAEVGSPTDQWIMCYPYGAYNKHLITLLKQKNCAIGLTTKVGKARLSPNNAYTLPRFDTNDLQNLVEGKKNAISV